jgi:RNA polymerase sigma-70 factor (ECF subfamily)
MSRTRPSTSFSSPAEPADDAVGSGAVGAALVDPAQEHRLVESARTGDEGAIEALYRTYYPVVYRYTLFRVGSATVAEDVTSQVFLGMVRHLPRFSWKGKPFVAWLYSIAQKQVAHHHRSTGRAARTVGLEQAEDLIADTAGPEATAQERERRLRLARALRMLPESQREVVLLRHVLSLSLAETAAAVDKTEGAVKQLQLRGLATLKDILGSRD